jgi:uncharacterized membrane protein
MANDAWTRWSVVLGFALGGFFDGILLHQILQWHHLLSLVPGIMDMRTQMLWDGYFHALMYVIAIVGLWGLWRSRHPIPEAEGRQGRRLVGAAAIGFGVWHGVDGVLAHWLLGIHRIKLDSPSPLMWDLGWLAAFGVAPIVTGMLLLRGRSGPSGGLRSSTMAVLLAALLTTVLASWSLRAPPGQRFTTVVFSPDVSPAQAMTAIVRGDARLVWSDANMGVVVVDVPSANRLSFYKHGALLVSGSGFPGGCFSWSRS